MGQAEAHCNVCSGPGGATTVLVRSNVRAFRDEPFHVWRCPSCLSIHTADDVDLAHYYENYPFHLLKLGWIAIWCFDNMLRRLRRVGLKKHHRILDYGCGSGIFVEYLRRRGYTKAVGYDAYEPRHNDARLLDATYDFVVSQDVVEHAHDPLELLRLFGRLAAPDAVVAIGTPNAEAIDLARPDDFVHTLHQPFHVCILSKRALLAAGRDLGWRLERYYPRQYSNLLLPFLNQRFFLLYMKAYDDVADVVFEGAPFTWALLSPRVLFMAFLGWFFSFELDVMAVFRVPAAPPAPLRVVESSP